MEHNVIEPAARAVVPVLGRELDALGREAATPYSDVFVTRELFIDLELTVAAPPTPRLTGGFWELLIDVDVDGSGFGIHASPVLHGVFLPLVGDPQVDPMSPLRLTVRDAPLPEYPFRLALRNRSGADMAPEGNVLRAIVHGVR